MREAIWEAACLLGGDSGRGLQRSEVGMRLPRVQLGHIENILIFFFEGPLGLLLGEAAELNFVRRK